VAERDGIRGRRVSSKNLSRLLRGFDLVALLLHTSQSRLPGRDAKSNHFYCVYLRLHLQSLGNHFNIHHNYHIILEAFACRVNMSPLATSGTAPLSSPPLQTHAITKNDSKGEKVLLIVGSDALPNGVRTIKTSIPRIARLSPRWVEAFNRGSKGRSYGVVKIRFPEDDAEAFNIIVMAAHDRFNALPQTLTLKGLVQLGRVAERYDLNHLLVGHIRAWLAPHRERVTQRGYEQWLYVAWQFGLENDFIALVNHLATRCKVDEEGRLLIPDTDQPLACQLPHGALGRSSTVITERS
jgi:hypothetical protein